MTKPPIFIQSCHASLEYDQARMLTDLGYPVFGSFDIGSSQRPKIPGVTDRNSDREDFGLILLHQVPDYNLHMEGLLMRGKRVVLSAFGQSDTWQYEAVANLCRNYPHGYIAAYSEKDYRLHLEKGCPPEKIRLLRFGKYLSDFEPWTGDSTMAYAAGNDIHNRGNGCGWELLKKVRESVPLVLSGKNTNEVGGLGEITEVKMHELMRGAACFISFGTAPAPFVMTQMEAWCAGCPTIIFNNGFGIAGEGLEIILCSSVEEVIHHAWRLIRSPEDRCAAHEASLRNAAKFDVKAVGPQWVKFIEEICA